MFEGQDQLGNIEPSPFFAEPSFPLQVPKEFTATLEVRDQIQVRVRLEAKLETNEERRVERTLEDLTFANRVRNLLLRNNFALREDLHSIYPLRVLLAHLEHAAERAAADELEEFEVAGHERALGLSRVTGHMGATNEIAADACT